MSAAKPQPKVWSNDSHPQLVALFHSYACKNRCEVGLKFGSGLEKVLKEVSLKKSWGYPGNMSNFLTVMTL